MEDSRYFLVVAGFCAGVYAGVKLHRSSTLQRLYGREPKSQKVNQALAVVDPFLDSEEPFKVAIAVCRDLGMTSGKIAAQCGHTVTGTVREATKKRPESHGRWEKDGYPVDIVWAKDKDEMMAVFYLAREKQLLTNMIHDAGRTQVSSGSATALSVGPAPASVVDSVIKGLKPYS